MLQDLRLLPPLAALAVVVVAQTQVRERSARAALFLTLGGAAEAGFAVALHFVGHLVGPLFWLGPVIQVGATGAVCYGLVTLRDELNPPVGTVLPPAIARLKDLKPNVAGQVFLGVFGLMALGASLNLAPPPELALSAIAVAAALWGSAWLARRSGHAAWVLERRPDLVVWSFVHHLTVVNRRYGTRNTYWSARLGLKSRVFVALPAASETEAQQLAASAAQLCPGVSLGYSPEQQSRFKTDPASLRR